MFRLSLALAKAKFKLRNEGSYFGIIWYLLNPMFFFLLLFFIFNDRIGGGIEKYPLFLLIGVILFSFFQSCTIESTRTISENRGIIRSIKFKQESLILANILNYLFSHIFEILIFTVFLIIFRINLIGLLFYPIILIFFCLFIYGISLALSAIIVYFPDLGDIWNFLTKLLWFATPIFYEIGGQTRLFFLNLFNPLYYFLTLTRDILIYNKIPELWIIIGATEYTLISLVIGIIIFKKLKKKFAEKI
ncbi:ABC-2 type transporter [uncultured archaeon]|nr:ABC-2 type transporter [uncultured archaeon]